MIVFLGLVFWILMATISTGIFISFDPGEWDEDGAVLLLVMLCIWPVMLGLCVAILLFNALSEYPVKMAHFIAGFIDSWRSKG